MPKVLPVLEQLCVPMQMVQRKQFVEKAAFFPKQSPIFFVFFLHLIKLTDPILMGFLLPSTYNCPITIMFYVPIIVVQKLYVQLCVYQTQFAFLFSIKYS